MSTLTPPLSTNAASTSGVVRTKLAVLRLAKYLGNVSRACEIMGYSRDSYYRFKKLYELGGADALCESPRRKRVPGNRVRPEIECACLQQAMSRPSWGQVQVSRHLSENGLKTSPASVRRIWLRHGLETQAKRLQASSRTAGP